MRRSSRSCGTLSEWRVEVLGLRQVDVARLAACEQAWISAVERGHLPRKWNRANLLMAYGLAGQDQEFERLVKGGAKARELAACDRVRTLAGTAHKRGQSR